jgi:hypothetical protein
LIAYCIYLLLFLVVIRYNGFFGLFSDNKISKRTFSFFFFLKAMAVPAFFFLYKKMYGGIESFDAGKFFFDSKTLCEFGKHNFPEYVKCMFGMQDESPGSHFYKCIIDPTFNWENGQLKDFFYNDNRVVIRIHSLIHFISFGSYFVHALINCFLSFIGISLIYRSFREYFQGKEFIVMVILCLFPSLWLYTGGLLKEGLCIFFLGNIIYSLKKYIFGGFTLSGMIWLIFLFFISCLLKPYILLSSLIFFKAYFWISKHVSPAKQVVVFISVLLVTVLAGNFGAKVITGKSLLTAAEERRKEFSDLSQGGIFLLDSVKFVRLNYDLRSISNIPGEKPRYRIKENIPYTYWEHAHQKDTLYCAGNKDTATKYSMVYMIPKAGSNVGNGTGSIFKLALKSLYYSLSYPLFYNTKGPMQLLASLENLFLLIAVLLSLIALFRVNENRLFILTILLLACSVFVVIGFTMPNAGAILRYRSPIAIFVLLAGFFSWIKLRKRVSN